MLCDLEKKRILNNNKEKEEKGKIRKFTTMKENKNKNLKFKKMIGEMPTIEKLKLGNPNSTTKI
jgi:hypothetical protein